MAIVYKTIDLFGNEQMHIVEKKRNSNKTLFDDYDAFVEKFKPKLTTDDCYTPKEVYQIILEYVAKHYDLNGKKIIRPFYPGGDYESIEYTDEMVVIDNPPFSIISKICKFYIKNNVKFFLFCPHLTAFCSDIDATYIIASADIIYENNAVVKTAFVTNMFFENFRIVGDAELHKKFKELNEKYKANLPKYEYPDNIITVSKIAYCVEKGVSIMIDKRDLKHYKAMDAQKIHGKAIYGGGFLASNRAAKALVEATKKAASVIRKKNEEKIYWELSDKELKIIEMLENNLKND